MAKSTKTFMCNQCGYETGKWLGKCPSCGEWNTVEEFSKPAEHRSARPQSAAVSSRPVRLSEISADRAMRAKTGMNELDRVLGGGLVSGSAVLLGGDPGIGKSTLLLQVCGALSKDRTVLYATGEESAAQIRIRAQRLGTEGENLYVMAETDLNAILRQSEALKCGVLIVDSIQTVYNPEIENAAGSVTQIRQAAAALTGMAKSTDTTVVIVGHVTKEGALAGPRVLEHLVDTVLYFEGDRYDTFRVLRAVKNRYGSTNEIGVFAMGERGMEEVADPSSVFLPDRESEVPGCAAFCAMEGSRPVMVELQALTAKTVFPSPRRMATGIDFNRVTLLLAVLEKKLGISLADQDAYVNVVGGLRVDERACDLAVAVAVYSALKNKPVPAGTAVIGEIGLTGEVRAVSAADKRVAECAKLGFERIILPKRSRAGITADAKELIGVETVADALRALF